MIPKMSAKLTLEPYPDMAGRLHWEEQVYCPFVAGSSSFAEPRHSGSCWSSSRCPRRSWACPISRTYLDSTCNEKREGNQDMAKSELGAVYRSWGGWGSRKAWRLALELRCWARGEARLCQPIFLEEPEVFTQAKLLMHSIGSNKWVPSGHLHNLHT